jgi:hypothetical protein
LAKAGIEILPCATNFDLRSVKECTIYTEDKPVHSYCIISTIIYVLGSDYKPICYNGITDNSYGSVFNKAIVMHDKVMSIIDISKNKIDLYADLPTMALINCGYYSQYGYYYCYQTTGIVFDKAQNYFSINNNSTISNEQLTVTNNSCSKSNIGSLININDSVELCFSEEAHAPLSSSGSYHLLMGTNSNSPFPSNDYPLLIYASSNYFINDYHSMLNSNYVDTATNMITTYFYESTFFDLLYSCKDGICSPTNYKITSNVYMYNSDSSSDYIYVGIMYSFYNNNKGKVIVERLRTSGVFAFLYNSGNGLVKVKDEDFASTTFFTSTTLPQTYLYYCQNGQCTLTNGFLKYKNSKGNIGVVYCYRNCASDVTYTSCAYSEIAYYDSKQSKFMLCIKDRTSPKKIVSIEIPENKKIRILDIFAANSLYYYLFESDGSGNIIGYSNAMGGLLYDIYENGRKELMGCYRTDERNPTFCQVLINYDGYYINIESINSNGLIYCTANSCDVVSENNGYFSNISNELIKCSESVCLLETLTYTSCIRSGEVISIAYNKNVNVYYCNGKTPTILPDNDTYYIVPNVIAKYTYPNLAVGKDTIILKANKYSVTQITTDDKGLCYDETQKTMIEDSQCVSAGLSHYYCSSICKTCTGEKESKAVYNIYAEQPSSCATYIEDSNLNSNSGALSILSYSKVLNIMIISLISLILLF